MGEILFTLVMNTLVTLSLAAFCLAATTANVVNLPGESYAEQRARLNPTWTAEFDLLDQADPSAKAATQCVAVMKKRASKAAHVLAHEAPAEVKGLPKGLKQVTCEKIAHGDINIYAKYRVIYHLNLQGGHGFELPAYKDGAHTLEAAQWPANCDDENDVCCDAWMWDS